MASWPDIASVVEGSGLSAICLVVPSKRHLQASTSRTLIGKDSTFPEVESGVDAQRCERIGEGEALFSVIVGVRDDGCADEVFAVVPHDARPAYQIEVDLLKPFEIEERRLVCALFAGKYFRFLVTDGRQEGEIGRTVLGKHPVVSVAEVQTVVGIFDFADMHRLVELESHEVRQSGRVEQIMM